MPPASFDRRSATLTLAAVPLIGVAAWQLDGLFLGTTQGAAVRNAGVLAMAAYLAVLDQVTLADILLVPLGHLSGRLPLGNPGRATVSAFAPML